MYLSLRSDLSQMGEGQADSQMVQWAMALATKSDDLSLVPRIHIMEEQDQLLQVVL